MDDLVLIDTCILIDYFKDNEDVIKKFDEIGKPYINSVIEMEILQGARDKYELGKIEKELTNFFRIHLSQNILNKATNLVKKYTLSHDLFLPDAVIAAHCKFYNIRLYTYNTKDFKYIEGMTFYN